MCNQSHSQLTKYINVDDFSAFVKISLSIEKINLTGVTLVQVLI